MKRKKICLAVLLLCTVAASAFLWLHNQAGKNSTIATVVQNGETLYTFDLSAVHNTQTYTIGEAGAQNTIRVSEAGIAVISADCPDQVCVYQGTRSHGPEPIVCLPHHLSIQFSAEADTPDAVTH